MLDVLHFHHFLFLLSSISKFLILLIFFLLMFPSFYPLTHTILKTLKQQIKLIQHHSIVAVEMEASVASVSSRRKIRLKMTMLRIVMRDRRMYDTNGIWALIWRLDVRSNWVATGLMWAKNLFGIEMFILIWLIGWNDFNKATSWGVYSGDDFRQQC